MEGIDWDKFKAPFPEKDIEWRIMRSGKNQNGIWAMCIAYVTNRAIMDRLDEAVGPDKWKNEFKPLPSGGILCGISIKIGDEWITKWDGAENTAVEAVKGGISGAMKRAAVQWGMGRYLYHLKEGFAEITAKGIFKGMVSKKNNKVDNKDEYYKWNPPALPDWALPEPEAELPPTFEEMKNKISSATPLPYLRNMWKKYGDLFEGEEKNELLVLCDIRKGELKE